MSKAEIIRYLNVIKRAASFIEAALEEDDGLLEELSQPKSKVEPKIEPHVELPLKNVAVEAAKVIETPTPPPPNRKDQIESLSQINNWPEAIATHLVAKDSSTEDQINRANAVLDMMVTRPLVDLNFLDFGCGDGWVTREALKRGAAHCTGYDIEPNKNWASVPGVSFTHIFSLLKAESYDVIMLYDVLDHCIDPELVMSQVKSLLKKDGVVYIRCHPWTSKHGTHLYKQGLNKAYFHLFLKPWEIPDITHQPVVFTRIEKDPLEAYRWWFKDFAIEKEWPIKDTVDEFFFSQPMKELLSKEQEVPLGDISAFLNRMQIQFVDYVLNNR